MARLHTGLPLSIDIGLMSDSSTRVKLRNGWSEFLSIDINNSDGTGPQYDMQQWLDGFTVFLEVFSTDWPDAAYAVSTLGQVLDLPDVAGGGLLETLLGRVASRLSTTVAVLQLLPVYAEVPTPMKWLATQIHATLGGVEELVHTINWRGDGPGNGVDPTLGTDGADLQLFCDTVASAWHDAMFVDPSPNPKTACFSSDLTYDYVKTALVSLDDAGGSQVQQGATYVTQFGAGNTGAAGIALPYPVACVATLRTVGQQTGGTSHGRENRGRLYFGGLSTVMCAATGGIFNTSSANYLAERLGVFFDDVHTTTDQHAAVVSKAHLLSHPITMIQMGVVPDTQRRRRRSQEENYANIWSGQLDTVTVS